VTAPDADEADRVAALHAMNILDSPVEERFERITALCTRLFDMPSAAINLIDADRQHTMAVTGADLADVPRTESFCDVAVTDRRPLVVEDLAADPRFDDNPFVTGDAKLRFYAGHPLHAPGGQAIGTLCIFDERPRTFSPGDLALLGELAAWVEEELAADEEQARAAAVQQGLNPQPPRADLPWDLAGACSPARTVGGDMYDWYDVPGGLAVTLADVMGKGMPAAIMMATLRAVLRAGSRHGDIEEAVQMAAQAMDADFGDAGAFATVLHAHLHEDGRTISYVDAGHGLVLLVGADGTTRRLPSSGLPVGPVVPGSWIPGTVLLEPGDQLVAFSDGLLDRHPTVDEAFAAVESAARAAPDPSALVDVLVRRPWLPRQDDDVTVLAVRRR
jgi:hypothetical protein